MPKAVIIYGPPGAGKGTQADLLACQRGFVHFDTGKVLERTVHDPANQKDDVIQRERRLFDSGKLNTPSWVLKIVKENTEHIIGAGLNIVYSGSPRTMFEAFGDSNHEGLMDLLEKLVGKKNINIIFLKIAPESSVHRNINRKVCAICGFAIIYNDETKNLTKCPLHGDDLKIRTVDDPNKMKIRLKEFEERTLPILEGLKERGYNIIAIDGEPLPYDVNAQILQHLNLS